jgi:hypothetical protein
MKKRLYILSFVLAFFISTNISAQANEEGYFTSEAVSVASDNAVFISVKKYNPTAEEIQQAAKPAKNAPMNYLQVPFTVSNASLYNNGFESMLYCIDKKGSIKWSSSTGFSKNSAAGPLAIDNNFLYCGEGMKEEGKIQLQKFDTEGKLIWSKTFDSLEAVNSIVIGGKMLNALVSFEVSKKIEHPDKSFSYKTYPVYSFLQLDIETGALIKKEYQRMGSYLSSIGFGNPYVSSYASYYLSNKDSAIFLNVNKQEAATVVSENLPKENKILNLVAGPSENHYLTLANQGKRDASYVLFSDFYGIQQKYDRTLSIKPGRSGEDRTYLLENDNDSTICIIAQGSSVSVCITDKTGKTDCSTKENFTKHTVAGAGLLNSKPYLIIISARDKPGAIGKISVLNY